MSDSLMGEDPPGEAQQVGEDVDPEIAALLDFEPVPRKRVVEDGWTAELQREFIARLAVHGSPGRACDEMGKTLTGMTKVKRSPLAASFRSAWEAAVTLAKRRKEEREQKEFVAPGATLPTIDLRRKRAPSPLSGLGGEGQVLNEYDEWEDQESLERRAEEAQLSIRNKLLLARRLYLQEISGSAGKRAAFEILVELPIDWELAAQLRPQADEPWRIVNMRQPDMLLTAENGWMGDWLPGPDKMAELRRAIDEYRAAEGLGPVDWDGDDEEEEEDEAE